MRQREDDAMRGWQDPPATTAILRDILMVRNKWFDEGQFTELVTIGQGLLEPTLVKLVISAALVQAGLIRGVTVFFLLNLPRIIVF